MKKILQSLLLLFFYINIHQCAAQALYSRQSGAWNDPNTWTISVTHVGGAATVPTTGDNVFISPIHTVTFPSLLQTCGSITFDGGGGGTLAVSGSSVLTIIGSGISGNGVINHNGGQIIVKGNSNLFTGSYFPGTTSCLSEFIYDGLGNQTIASLNYDKLTLGGTGIKTFSSGLTSPIINCFYVTGTANTDLGIVTNLTIDKTVTIINTFKFPNVASTVTFNGNNSGILTLANATIDMSVGNLAHSWTILNSTISNSGSTLINNTGGTTVNYAGVTNQTILPYVYENLQLGGSGTTKSLSTNTTIKGWLLIGTGVNFIQISFNIDIYGDWQMGGSYSSSPSAIVQFLGSLPSSIIGSASGVTFPNLSINKLNNTVATDLKITATSTTIASRARFDLKTVTGHNLGNLTGGGTLAITSLIGTATFPVYSGTAFFDPTGNTGSTVEYYGLTPYNLPSQNTYNKLLFKDAAAKTAINPIVVDSIEIKAASIFNGNTDVTVKNNVKNDGQYFSSGINPLIINSSNNFNLEGAGSFNIGVLNINNTSPNKKVYQATSGAFKVNSNFLFNAGNAAIYDLGGGKTLSLGAACTITKLNAGSAIRMDYASSSISKAGAVSSDYIRSYPISAGVSSNINTLDIQTLSATITSGDMSFKIYQDLGCTNCVRSYPSFNQTGINSVTQFSFKYFYSVATEIIGSPIDLVQINTSITSPQSAAGFYGPSITSNNVAGKIDGNWRFLGLEPTITSVEKAGGGLTITNGCLGQTIRVIGTNYQATGMSISINGGSPISTYTFFGGANAIEFVIPLPTPLSGPGISITNGSGTSGPYSFALSSPLTVIDPIISSPFCEGSPFSITASVANGGIVNYQWQFNNSNIGGANTIVYPISVLNLSHAGNYRLVATSATCQSTVTTNNATLIVNQKPSSSDAYTPTIPNIFGQCQTATFTMAANTPVIGTGVWTCLSGCAGVSISNPSSATTLVTGIPEETPISLRWTISSFGCADSASALSLYNYSAPGSPAAIVGAPSQDICISTPTTTLTGNTSAVPFTSVGWLTISGPSASVPSSPTASSTSFAASAVGTYIFNYIIRNGSCISVSPNLNVTVHAVPIVNAGADQTKCFGGAINLNGFITNGLVQNWLQAGGAGTISTTTTLNPTYTPVGADVNGASITFSLIGVNAGCGSISDDVIITLLAQPTATITPGTAISICAGGTALLPITLVGQAPFSGLGVFDGTTALATGTINTNTLSFPVSPTSSKNYTLSPLPTFKDFNNCVGVFSGNRNVTVSAAPTATITASSNAICASGSTNINLTPSGGGVSVWTLYYNSGGLNTSIVASGAQSIPVSPSTTTTYTIDSIETSTCGKIDLIGLSTTITVNTAPNASALLTLTSSDDTLCEGEFDRVKLNNIENNTMYKLVKNFNKIPLDSFNNVSGSTSIDMVLPYSKFTIGSVDTLYFLARRTGCPAAQSVNNSVVWSSNLAAPTIGFNAANAPCNTKIIQINSPQAGISYQWFESGNQLVGKTLNFDTAYFAGTYKVIAKDALLCLAVSNAVVVNYDALKPKVTLNDISATETILTSSTVSNEYRWYAKTTTGLKLIEGETNRTISVYFDGIYYLGTINSTCYEFSQPYTVTSKLGGNLLKQSFIESDSSIIIPKVDFSIDVKIAPNPVVSGTDMIINYIAGDVTKVSFILYNAQGIMMNQLELDGNGMVTTKIDTKNLPSGIYSLYISDGVKQISKNIMIY